MATGDDGAVTPTGQVAVASGSSSDAVLDPWNTSSAEDQQELAKHIMFTTKNSGDLGIVERNDFNNSLNAMLSGSGGMNHLDGFQDEREVVQDESLTEEQKKARLQTMFSHAASNGDHVKVGNMLKNVRSYLDPDQQDEDGTTPLIYATCFGHVDVAFLLLEAGAQVDAQDRYGWSPLMWATNNNHEKIVQMLLDKGASSETKSARGRTVHDFIAPENIRIQNILHLPPRPESSSSSSITSGRSDDWYQPGNAEEQFQSNLAESEMKRRMLMESAYNLEVDLASLGIDEEPESPIDEEQEFVWDRCLPDQMFVFSASDLPHMLDIVITNMQPIRSRAQKPVPANLLFLSSRFAHYYSSPDLLENLLYGTVDRIDRAVKTRPEDMTLLAFWISNCTLLLYYLKKDHGLVIATAEYQLRISELINEIYVLLIRDGERRVDRVMDPAILDHETIPGFEDVRFEGEWRVLRSLTRRGSPSPNNPTSKENKRKSTTFLASSLRPPSPRRSAMPSPRNVTSLLSSTLFVLQTYEIHTAIIEQAISQIFYWMACELFNRILTRKKYLCRSKAMQIRLNISTLEDWTRVNRLPTKRVLGVHFAPLMQLLQWLQCFSQLQDFTELIATIKTLNLLNPAQMLKAVRDYRYEVHEEKMPAENEQYLMQLQVDYEKRQAEAHKAARKITRPSKDNKSADTNGTVTSDDAREEIEFAPATTENLGEMKDSRYMLPFALPTSAEMLVVSSQIPSQPPDGFMEKLDSKKQKESGDGNTVTAMSPTDMGSYGGDDEDDDRDDDNDDEDNEDAGATPRPSAMSSPWAD